MSEWTAFWACTWAEIKALGWRCVLYGPEIWLAVAALAGAWMLALIVCWVAFAPEISGGKDEDDDDSD